MTNSELFRLAHARTKADKKPNESYNLIFGYHLKQIKAEQKGFVKMSVGQKLAAVIKSVVKPDSTKRQAFDDSGLEHYFIVEKHKDAKMKLSEAERTALYGLGLLPTTYGGFAMPQRTNWQAFDEYITYLHSLKALLVASGFNVDFSRRELNGYYTSL